MPEAAVHEDSRAVRPHHDVRFAGHALHVQAVAVAVVPQPAAHLQLGFRVPAADVRHAPVPLLSCHRVGHKAISSWIAQVVGSGRSRFGKVGLARMLFIPLVISIIGFSIDVSSGALTITISTTLAAAQGSSWRSEFCYSILLWVLRQIRISFEVF